MLRVTDTLVERVAAELGQGGWRYTLRQLYYAACAEAEVPPNNAAANGQISLGLLLVLVGLILVRLPIAFAVLAALGGTLVLLGVVARVTRREPTGRVLAVSYEEFTRQFSGLILPGLIDVPAAELPGEGDHAIVCDTRETAAALAANLASAGVASLAVLAAEALPQPLPWPAVAAVHDCSPRGCALVLELRDQGIEVVDCGLRPEAVDSRQEQVIEGAPARPPRDLSPLLSESEVSWLASGRRVELATRSPKQLLDLVKPALERLPRRQPQPH